MTPPNSTRREFNKILAALPIAGLPVAKAAATPVPESGLMPNVPDELVSVARLTAEAAARRPLRLYARLHPSLRVTEGAVDCRPKIAHLSWAAKTLDGPGFVVELLDHPLVVAMARHTWIPGSTGRDKIEATASDLLQTGRSCWFVSRGRDGMPLEFWPLLADKSYRRPDGSFQYDGSDGKSYLLIPPSHMIEFLMPTVPGIELAPWGAANMVHRNELDASIHSRAVNTMATTVCNLIAMTLTGWTHRHPLATERGWDRLVWAFDDTATNL